MNYTCKILVYEGQSRCDPRKTQVRFQIDALFLSKICSQIVWGRSLKAFIWKLFLAMMNLSMVYLKIGIKIIWIKFMSGLKLDQAIPFMSIN